MVATCYPDLELARDYPAYGLPGTPDEHSTIAADVKGNAAILELYLGRDSLTRPGGPLYPATPHQAEDLGCPVTRLPSTGSGLSIELVPAEN